MTHERKMTSRVPVLAIDREHVEWLYRSSGDGDRVSEAVVSGSGPAAFAEAAAAAVRAAGGSPGRCVLALGTGFVRQRLFTLPVLSRAETRSALARKAAGLCDTGIGAVAFSALRVDDTTSSDAKDLQAGRRETRWLVIAQERDEARDVRLALSKFGFRITRVVSNQLSCLARARASRSTQESACIVVSTLRRCASVALMQGDAVLNENVLDGDVRTQPALAMSLVQEIKSFDAAWRKANRGGAVGEVILIGLPVNRALLFKAAVQAALPSAIVTAPDAATPTEPSLTVTPGSDNSGRVEALAACREVGGLQLDLTLPSPVRPRVAALLLVALSASLATVATIAYRPARSAELKELEAIAAIQSRTTGLEELRRHNDQSAAALAELDLITARNGRILARGWPLRSVAGEVLTALGDKAALTGMQLGPAEKGLVEITGVTSPNPARAMLDVQGIRALLASDPRWNGVSTEPAGTVPTGERPISFTLKAHRRP